MWRNLTARLWLAPLNSSRTIGACRRDDNSRGKVTECPWGQLG
jgi:hypothetical protein